MYEKKAAMFLYCVSPVHMGAGTAIGAIDNPIQRERHTEHPMMAGSGIKGALRDVFEAAHDKDLTNRVFGPDSDASDHAGAIAISDAQIVLFPVRSLRRSYVYATCPTALARLQRLLLLAGVGAAKEWQVADVGGDHCLVAKGSQAVAGGALVLEAFQFAATEDEGIGVIAKWFKDNALPGGEGFAYFGQKVASDLVVLSDERFNYFVRHATVVEPHVRIDDASGTADDGGLFYTENLPPESLLVSLVMASKERVKKGEKPKDDQLATAAKVLEVTRDTVGRDPGLAQLGGDATTGRGQVVLRFVGGA